MKKSNLAIYSAVFVIIASIIGSIFLDMGDKITSAITICTAIIGALGLFMQFKKDKKINQLNFITTFSYQFYDQSELKQIMSKMEKYRKGDKKAISEADYDDIVSYLQWCEMLATLINKKVFSFEFIDNIFSYRFFLVTNNAYVQKAELFPEKEFYGEIYQAYKLWVNYKIKNGLPIMQAETPLI